MVVVAVVCSKFEGVDRMVGVVKMVIV